MARLTAKKLLLSLSIALNALCAGGIFTFPLISPALAASFKLTQPQLTTIVLGGMMSQYTVAALAGSVIDNYGAHLCSLVAAVLFGIGYGGFALEVHYAPTTPTASSSPYFYHFTLYFLFAGLGTVFSYFSSLFSASLAFPNHAAVASGVSMAFFGLSPMFLSTVCGHWFTDSVTELVVVERFMAFMFLLTTFVCVLGFFNLRQARPVADAMDHAERVPNQSTDERTPLLNDSPTPSQKGPLNLSVKELLLSADFWLLCLACVMLLGVSEMIISNIGTIALSLPPTSSRSTLLFTSSTANQVKLISISNTITRFLIGPIADFVSPVASYLPCGTQVFPRKHRISRFAFLVGPALLLDAVFLWMEFGVNNQSHLWVLSIGTGMAYSTVFTILPSIISSLWGMQNMGRNFGLMMYAPFTGTPLFSYLYAFIATANSSDPSGICAGRACWQSTFWVTTGTSFIACILSVMLWRRWQGKM